MTSVCVSELGKYFLQCLDTRVCGGVGVGVGGGGWGHVPCPRLGACTSDDAEPSLFTFDNIWWATCIILANVKRAC